MASGATQKDRPGQVLFNKGEPSDFMYVVVSGAFDVGGLRTPAAETWPSPDGSRIFTPEM